MTRLTLISPSVRWSVFFATLRSLATGVPCVVLAIAGLGKFIDLGAFNEDLRSWTIIPSELAPALVILVPSAEVILGVAWLVGFHRRGAAIAALWAIGVFTGAAAAQYLTAKPPTCSCFGAMLRFRVLTDGLEGVLIRNGVLFLAGCIGMYTEQRSRRVAHYDPNRLPE